MCSKRRSRTRRIAAYRQAAALQPKDPEPHLAAGLLLEKQNKFADAEQEYKQALALDPSSTDALTGLANIYMRGRRFPEAEANLRKLVAAHPDEAGRDIQLGRVLAAEGKNDDGIAELQAGRSWLRRTSRCSAIWPICTSAGEEIRSGRSRVPRLAGRSSQRCRTAPESRARPAAKKRNFAEAQQEFLAAVKLKPDLGDGVWRSGLRRQ